MPLPRKPPRSFIAQRIQMLVRSFPSETVTITRPVKGLTAGKTSTIIDENIIYQGEALWIPSGGTVEVLGLGKFVTAEPRLMLTGTRDIRQGDRMEHDGREYEIANVQNRWNAFMIFKLTQTKKLS